MRFSLGRRGRKSGCARDDKGESGVSMKSGGWTEVVFHHLGWAERPMIPPVGMSNSLGPKVCTADPSAAPDFLSGLVTPQSSCGFPCRKPQTLVSPAPLAGNPGALGMTKGRVALPFGVMAILTTSQALFISPSTCRRQVRLLGMTRGGEDSIESDRWTEGVSISICRQTSRLTRRRPSLRSRILFRKQY
jgi:hypothetical protein